MPKIHGHIDPDVEAYWRDALAERAKGHGSYSDDIRHITYATVQRLFNELDDFREDKRMREQAHGETPMGEW